MQRIVCPLVFLFVLELCSHGETKTIVFSSYTSAQPAEATGRQQHPSHNDSNPSKEASESSGRAFSSGGGSGFPFSIHPDFLSKPVPVARPDTGYKTPKYIVYPSYSENSRNSVPYYNAPVAATDRFAPGEAYGGTLYKLKKQKQPFASAGGGGAPFASFPAASFNRPVSVLSPNLLRPAASDNSPVSVLAPPSGAPVGQSGPPAPPSSPPSSPPAGPPSQTFFMPTPVPNSGEDTPPPSHATDTLMDSSEVVLFPPNSHTGYLPPANKVPTEPGTSNGYLPPRTEGSSHESTSGKAVYKPSSDLFKFPPNINASYLPPGRGRPKNPVTSYLPPPSGDTDNHSSAASSDASPENGAAAELFKFPPNVNTGYLPPGGVDSSKLSATSYLPPPSGDPRSPAYLMAAGNTADGPELHRFPPNVNSDYLPPSRGKPSSPSATSYLPPPSGDPKSPANSKPLKPSGPTTSEASVGSQELSPHKFPPNIQSGYLPSKESSEVSVTSYLPPPSGNPNAPAHMNPSAPSPITPRPSPSHGYIPPLDLYKFPPNVHSPYLPPYHSVPRPNNAVTSYLPPASGIPGDDAIGTIPVGPGKPQYLPPSYPDSGPPPMKMPPMTSMMQSMAGAPEAPMGGPPTGPSGMEDDHQHHHHHHHDPSHDHHHPEHDFPYLTGFDHDHYPDIIYDHDHFHHHHHDEPPTTPAPPPPPPVPETPRLKNYSYYYLSRTLWYVPLYFTLYFTFYVAILIIRSIARHKVNLPNQWVGNGRSFSGIRDLSDAETQRKATMMAAFTMQQIEDFREKYL